MKMHAVESSQIASIGHKGSTLAVMFHGGATYHYHDVTAAAYKRLKAAKSVGAYFSAHIKLNHKCTGAPE